MSMITMVCQVCCETYTVGVVGSGQVGGHVCPVKVERDEAIRLLANATDPENEGDWEEAREVGWAWVKERADG